MTDRYLVPPLGGLATAVSTITGQEVVETLWAIDQLSRVAAFTLADGAEVVAKARPWEPRLEACGRAQSKAAASGIPCPRPMGSATIDGWAVAVEEHLPGGDPRPVQETGIQVLVDLCLALDDAVGDLAEAEDVDPEPDEFSRFRRRGPIPCIQGQRRGLLGIRGSRICVRTRLCPGCGTLLSECAVG